MNFFAHAMHCLDDPAQCVGVAIPDWLPMLRPRIRCRSRHASPWIEDPSPDFSSLAQGVVRHHHDDGWFHQSRAFNELSIDFARRLRVTAGDDHAFRPGFVGHILVELLLDATLIADRPGRLDQYYRQIESVDPDWIARAVGRMTGHDASGLSQIVRRFCEIRFLADYQDDGRLTWRINQVLARVKLPELPPGFAELLPEAREEVRLYVAELTTPGDSEG